MIVPGVLLGLSLFASLLLALFGFRLYCLLLARWPDKAAKDENAILTYPMV